MSVLGIAGSVTGVAAAAAVIWRVWSWGAVLVEGMKCQLRSDMTRTYYKNRDDKKMRQYEYESFKANFAAYTALGGNSFVKHINEEIDTWEITP